MNAIDRIVVPLEDRKKRSFVRVKTLEHSKKFDDHHQESIVETKMKHAEYDQMASNSALMEMRSPPASLTEVFPGQLHIKTTTRSSFAR